MNRKGSHAIYTNFVQEGTSEVIISLESDDERVDTYLYLIAGDDPHGPILYQNDDDVVSWRSRIQATLEPGTYTIEATTLDPGETGFIRVNIKGLVDIHEIIPETPVSITTTETEVCAVASDGKVICKDTLAYLGDTAPKNVRFVALTSGSMHTCGLSTEDKIWCWGSPTRWESLGNEIHATESMERAMRINASIVVVNEIGSGFIVNERGDVITNYRTVYDAASVQVRLHNGQILDGEVIGRDRNLDLALIRLPEGEGLQHLPLVSSAIVDHSRVWAVGYPHNSDTMQVVGDWGGGRTYGLHGAEWIRMDSPISLGMAGGPMVDNNGYVVGVMVSRDFFGEHNNMSAFSLASEVVKERLKFLTAGGTAPQPPRFHESDGRWIFHIPNCPDDYENCVPQMRNYNKVFATLDAIGLSDSYRHEPVSDYPTLTIGWDGWSGLVVRYDTNGLSYESREGVHGWVFVDNRARAGRLYPSSWGSTSGRVDSADFTGEAAIEIARLLYKAEFDNDTIEIGILSNQGQSIGVFEPEGFTKNYWTLPCAE